jgi:hypothetical protein
MMVGVRGREVLGTSSPFRPPTRAYEGFACCIHAVRGIVGVPLLWGIYGKLINALKLFE